MHVTVTTNKMFLWGHSVLNTIQFFGIEKQNLSAVTHLSYYRKIMNIAVMPIKINKKLAKYLLGIGVLVPHQQSFNNSLMGIIPRKIMSLNLYLQTIWVSQMKINMSSLSYSQFLNWINFGRILRVNQHYKMKLNIRIEDCHHLTLKIWENLTCINYWR